MLINVFVLIHYLCHEMVVNVFVLLNTLSDNSKYLTAINNTVVINKNASEI